MYASAFAVAGRAIPCVLDEQVVTLGGAIEVGEYASSASDELAQNAVAALGDRAAVLLAHHGVIGVGEDLEEAVAAVDLIERVAQIHAVAESLGAARVLPADVVLAQQQIYRMMKGFRA
jgi:L-fuculose-phosphate aldolase